MSHPVDDDGDAERPTIEVDGDVLGHTLRMGAVGLPLQHRLSARLRRA